jgi:hypothetical protein
MSFTFNQIKDALQECTSYDLILIDDEDADEYAYALIDAYGDQDGDPFYDLDDVVDFVCNNEQVEEYLSSLPLV